MAGLKTLLGLYPKTTVYELKRKQLEDEYNALKEFETSDELARFKELEQYCKSAEFQSKKSELLNLKYKGSEEHRRERDFKYLKKDSSIKKYLKDPDSVPASETEKINRYNELSNYVNSEAFLEKKGYLTMSSKQRWKQSEPFKLLEEFNQLKNSPKIKWFSKNKNHKKFEWFNTWNLTFEDDFDTGKLDAKKWITKYFWGEKMIKESYSLGNEKQYFTDGKNLEFNGSVVRIITRKEMAEGKAWIKDHGFIPRKFDFTSGIINTGQSFRQKYGLFEAKIRFANPNSLMNAFWMVGDRSKPHLDVAKAFNKCSVGLTLDDKQKFEKAIGRNRFSNDFHIFSMEWLPNSIVWKINGLEVKTIKQNIPDQEMYLNFSASVYSDVASSGLPSSMEIDWVRCYSKTT